MTLQDFQSMNRREQIDILFHCGTRLGTRYDDHFIVALYQVEYFYVEVFYDRLKRCTTDISSFSNTTELDPYLEEIDISAVLQQD